MIRLFEEEDLDEVLAIWLDANLRAHSFIPAGYWEGRREEVRQALPQAELYVWEEQGEILGFLGLEGDDPVQGMNQLLSTYKELRLYDAHAQTLREMIIG